MLARRFTIVCLLIALFGMALSTLVAQTGRRTYDREIGAPYTRDIGPSGSWQTG